MPQEPTKPPSGTYKPHPPPAPPAKKREFCDWPKVEVVVVQGRCECPYCQALDAPKKDEQ
jgi:hypothetical protein